MPFKRKKSYINSIDPHAQTDVKKIFIGRKDELFFFVQNILKPEEPTHNIISISGQGGVGKSTLIARFIDEAGSYRFKDYCLPALVNERQSNPVSMMEKFADQLHHAGHPLKKFEEALARYKDALRRMRARREDGRETFLRGAADVISSVTEDVPFLGGLLHQGANTVSEILLEKDHMHQILKDAEQLENPIGDLTRVFVEELNGIADNQVTLGARIKHNRRIILFFDTFEQLALEAAPWLLDYFLEADISPNVVLVVAGRDSIKRSTPDDPKRWLPYLDDEIIYSISLDSFTREEVCVYLAKRGITDTTRIDTIWKLSHGLPLFLCLLTSSPQGKVDPTADVVANFLRWIPKREEVERRLVLDVALMSRPFNQDDLTAFTYLPDQERSTLYHWLIGQPFVQSSSQDGRYVFHELAQELFSRHLYQRSRNEYQATRRALAEFYRQLLRKMQLEEGEKMYNSAEWLELVLALTQQLFLLPDETSHIKAIEQILLYTYLYTEQVGEIVRVLRQISEDRPSNQTNASARRTMKFLLQYLEANLESQAFLTAASYLLEKVLHEPSFSIKLLASIYNNQGISYRNLKRYEQAIANFNEALKLDPNYALAYAGRGNGYWRFGRYQEALQDYDRAITLDPKLAWAYAGRGETYRLLKEYRQAIQDYNRTLELNQDYIWVYVRRGRCYFSLKEYQQAIEDFDHALALDPKEGSDYLQRGLAYLCLRNVSQASADFIRSWEVNSTNVNHGWMAEWAKMCRDEVDAEMPRRLQAIAAIDPQRYEAYICRGVAFWFRGDYEKALAELDRAIPLDQEEWDAYFWKGMVLVYQGRGEETMELMEKAIEVGLPPVLLTPLRWIKQDKPDFFEKYIMPFLNHFNI
jgi:tetratricopeptide (TPR) repeat protein